MFKEIILVGTGSFIGGTIRYIVSVIMRPVSNGFPWGTLIVNTVGCLLIGLLWGYTTRFPNLSQHIVLFIGVGLCGGFTTFSTFSKESLLLFQSGSYIPFALYAIGSVAIGLLVVALGFIMTK